MSLKIDSNFLFSAKFLCAKQKNIPKKAPATKVESLLMSTFDLNRKGCL